MQAIIDIGSTSVRLCFCDLEKAVNEKQVETTRLAENQTADGGLWRPALIRTAEAVEKFVSVARSSGFEPEIFATEAVRSASNRDEFLQAVPPTAISSEKSGTAPYSFTASERCFLTFSPALSLLVRRTAPSGRL